MKTRFNLPTGHLTAAFLALCLAGCGDDDVTKSTNIDRTGIVGGWIQMTPDFQGSGYVFTADSQFTYLGGGFALAPDDKLWSEGTFVFDNDSLTLQAGAVVLRDVATIDDDLDMLQLAEGSSARSFARADPRTSDKGAVTGVYNATFTVLNPSVYQFTVGEAHSGTLTVSLSGAQINIAIYSQDFIILNDALLLFRAEQGPVVRLLYASLGFLGGGNPQINAKPFLLMGEFTSQNVTGILKFRVPLGLTEEFTCEVAGQKSP